MPIASAWFRALTLGERRAVLAGRTTRPDHGDAAGYWTRWRAQPPFADEALFVRRLAQANLDPSSFRAILDTSETLLHGHHAQLPPWLATLSAAYALRSGPLPEPGDDEDGFLEVVRPLIDTACLDVDERVRALVATWPDPPFDPETIGDLLLANLFDPLLLRLGRTMVLELNVARLLDQLDGETAAARFQRFVTRLQDPAVAWSILADYPVLARQLVICIAQWREVSCEVLARLCSDWDQICRLFSPTRAPGKLVALRGGAGDTHRNGRSVMIAEFASGLRIVYKPKSLAVDRHFQELLVWLNGRGCSPPLRPLRILDRREYGWVEFVAHRGCDTRAQVARYYRRLGAHLALLYVINASDFHLENLIADADQPILIDLETLFNPEFERFDDADALSKAAQAMLDSVLVVGMLPQRLWSDDAYGGIDISGLGGEEGQLSPDRLPMPDAIGTDEMHYVRTRTPLEAEANRPMLQGEVTSAVDYQEDLLAGFRTMYGLLLAHREELLAADGPLACFADDETRLLLRPTRTYDQLLFESFHPDMLHDGLARDLHWDRLWLAVPDRPFMADIVPAEQEDLRTGDIPVFTTRPASMDLFDARGERIPGVVLETGMAVMRRRFARLGNTDLARQEWIIRCTLATVSPAGRGFDRPQGGRATSAEPGQMALGRQTDRLLTVARNAADWLLASAIEGEDDIVWLGLTPLPQEYWDFAPLDMDLYGGVAGVALFLAYAGEYLDDERYRRAARRGHNALNRHVEQLADDVPGIGGFVGWGGALYTLTHLAALWHDAEILAQAEAVVAAIARFVPDDEAFGVVYGAAGAIAALLAYESITGSPAARRAAVACGDHLIAAAQPQVDGLGWVNADYGPEALTGFGYGAAGIGWALLELAAATGDMRFRHVAEAAFRYERSRFLADVGNWPDLRATDAFPAAQDGASTQCMAAWCHGAVGIGLARIRALSHLDDAALHGEIDAALATARTLPTGGDQSLCHGLCGTIELLLQAERLQSARHWHAERVRLMDTLLDDVERRGWRCGGPEAVEMPSLMLGIAGIGYQLLRLAKPAQIPSLLLLAPPARESDISGSRPFNRATRGID